MAANKFLPFVVEQSTPLHIFTTLLSRSKAMNNVVVASIFYMVLVVGIEPLRAFVKTLPDMGLEKLYEEMLGKFPEARVDSTLLKFFLSMGGRFQEATLDKIHADVRSMALDDIMIFFMVLSQNAETAKHLKDWTDLPFQDIAENADHILSNIKGRLNFSDTGTPVQFKDPFDLQAYIIYRSILAVEDQHPVTIRATFSEKFDLGASA